MTAPITAKAEASRLQPIFDRLERDHFPASRFSEPDPGVVAAQFFQSRLTSAFQPIVRASDRGVAGHHALLRVFNGSGDSIAPWKLFAQDSSDRMLVQLDRLTRTLHALNYFQDAHASHTLFLNIDTRLLTIVADAHGAYFELILSILGIPPTRIALVMPSEALDDPVTFVRAAISYRMRGYRVAAQMRSDATADLEHVFLAEPHFVAIDAPADGHGDTTRRLVETLGRRGIHALARRIEDAAQAQAALDVGFGFLQGTHFDDPR